MPTGVLWVKHLWKKESFMQHILVKDLVMDKEHAPKKAPAFSRENIDKFLLTAPVLGVQNNENCCFNWHSWSACHFWNNGPLEDDISFLMNGSVSVDNCTMNFLKTSLDPLPIHFVRFYEWLWMCTFTFRSFCLLVALIYYSLHYCYGFYAVLIKIIRDCRELLFSISLFPM